MVTQFSSPIAAEADIDPDIEQAKADLLHRAAHIRTLTQRMVGEPAGSRPRLSLEGDIRDQMSFIIARAERIAIAPGTLMMILNAELDAKARRGRAAPAGETIRTIRNLHEQAMISLQQAELDKREATARANTAIEQIAAAEDAIRFYEQKRIAR